MDLESRLIETDFDRTLSPDPVTAKKLTARIEAAKRRRAVQTESATSEREGGEGDGEVHLGGCVGRVCPLL